MAHGEIPPAVRPGWQQGSTGCPRLAAPSPNHCHCSSSPTLWVWKWAKGGRSTPAAPSGDSDPCSPLRMQCPGFLLLALLTLLVLTSEVAKKKDKVKMEGRGSECTEWTWRLCILSSKDCGVSCCQGTYRAQTLCIWCQVPGCTGRRKEEFGADCEYKFETFRGM